MAALLQFLGERLSQRALDVLLFDEISGAGDVMAAKDKELNAISSIIDLLKPLNSAARGRVLEYVLKRLDMEGVGVATEVSEISVPQDRAAPAQMDIRTLTADKQPRSASEMVALIAYYISELAPDGEKAETINVGMVRKYFKMAGFPMPRAPQAALPNAVAAGYLQNVSRGEYRLNPVGYNLVVHSLPRGSGGPASEPHKRSTRRRNR